MADPSVAGVTAYDFPALLKAERDAQHFTQRSLAAALAVHGFEYTGAAVGTWEHGKIPPRDVVWALEEILGCDGMFTDALGLKPRQAGPTPYAALEARLTTLEGLVQAIRDEIRAQP